MFNFTFQYPDLKKCLFFFLALFIFLSFSFPENEKEDALILTCPDDVIVNPMPGECGTFIDYSMLEWSSTLELADTIFNPGPQNYFPYGVTTVTLTTTSTGGTQESCVFNVFVQQFPTPLVCNQNVFVFMVEDCFAEVNADMILLGGPYGCNDAYDVNILSPIGEPLGNVVEPSMVGDIYEIEILDNQTNMACYGSIIPRADSLPQSILCPADITIRCHEPTEPFWTGEPSFETCFPVDDVTLEFDDDRVNSFCDEDEIAFDIVRTWTVTNPFGGSNSCVQHIYGQRLMINEVIFPPDYDGTDFPPLGCPDSLPALAIADTAITGIPLVNGFDPHFLACNFSVDYVDSVENICGSSYLIMREWTALDYCRDEKSVHVQNIIIEDTEPPFFSVPDPIYASISSACGLTADFPPIENVQECSSFTVVINTPWGQVNGNGGSIQIPFDEGEYEIDYSVIDDCGNGNVVTTNLIIQQEVLPACPPLMTISSQYYSENLEAALDSGDYSVLAEFGYPDLPINCLLTLTEEVSVNLDDCLEGTIFRSFGVEETNGGCTQLIQVNHVSDFVVEFPTDTTFICGSGVANYGEPILTNNDIEDIEISFTDEVFTNVPDVCFQIQRTWVVKNNCVTGSQDDNEAFEVSEADLGLPFPDCDLDGDGDCDDRTFRDSWSTAFMPGEAEASQTTNPDTDPDSDPWDGYIVYVQEINVLDSVAPVFINCEVAPVCVVGSDCSGEVSLSIPEISECGDFTLSAQVSFGGPTQTGLGPFQNVSPGVYEVIYFAIDDCENQSSCETTIEVVDCTPPTPICQTQVVATIEAGTPPSVGLFAPDLNNGSTDNCPGGLLFSFSSDPGDLGRVFFCDDLGQQTLTLYVSDLAGNQDSCDIFILVQEPSPGFCGGTPSMTLPGNIYTEQSVGIEGVEVATSQGFTSITDGDGAYSVAYQDMGSSFEVTPFLDSDPSNGVTTFDALLVVKHVLGTEPLNSPYKIIAADVNGTNSVTTFDALVIRQMVLNAISEFPAGSWRFVPEDYSFPNPNEPFASSFPESSTIPIPAPAFGPDFIGMKVGDLNNSADPNFAFEVNDRSYEGIVKFSLPDLYVQKGKVIEVPLILPNEVLHGFQFAIEFDEDQLDLINIDGGILDDKSWAQSSSKSSVLKVSWYSAIPLEQSIKAQAMTLNFMAKNSGNLNQMISLSQNDLAPEAYTSDLNVMEIKLDFDNAGSSSDNLILHDIRPLPFLEFTLIPFEIPNADQVELLVFDLSGRAVKHERLHVTKGYNEFKIIAEDLPTQGVYLFQIRTSSGTLEGKLVYQ